MRSLLFLLSQGTDSTVACKSHCTLFRSAWRGDWWRTCCDRTAVTQGRRFAAGSYEILFSSLPLRHSLEFPLPSHGQSLASFDVSLVTIASISLWIQLQSLKAGVSQHVGTKSCLRLSIPVTHSLPLALLMSLL